MSNIRVTSCPRLHAIFQELSCWDPVTNRLVVLYILAGGFVTGILAACRASAAAAFIVPDALRSLRRDARARRRAHALCIGTSLPSSCRPRALLYGSQKRGAVFRMWCASGHCRDWRRGGRSVGTFAPAPCSRSPSSFRDVHRTKSCSRRPLDVSKDCRDVPVIDYVSSPVIFVAGRVSARHLECGAHALWPADATGVRLPPELVWITIVGTVGYAIAGWPYMRNCHRFHRYVSLSRFILMAPVSAIYGLRRAIGALAARRGSRSVRIS